MIEDIGVEQLVVAVASALNRRLGDITHAMSADLARAVADLGDERLQEILRAAVEGNVETIIHILQHGISPEHVEPPSAAFEHARRLAQNGVPAHSLVRAYRLGQDHLLEDVFEELDRLGGDEPEKFRASRRIVSVTFSYIDWITQEVIAVYEEEQSLWSSRRGSTQSKKVRDLIEGRDNDAGFLESAFGYRIDQYHLGVVLWTAERPPPSDVFAQLETTIRNVERTFESHGRALVVPRDKSSIWAWVPLGRRDPSRKLAAEIEAGNSMGGSSSPVSIALGAASYGLDGFRLSHRQAIEAQRVASIAADSNRQVISYGEPEVRAAAILCGDLEQARMLVQTVLGQLAVDDQNRGQLRESLLTFLSTSCNYTATAERLSLHKNSVRYRIAKAQQERGAAVDDTSLDVELALVACRWFGSAVLLPSRAEG